eukprot:6707304-Prymnesium_polylepis.2
MPSACRAALRDCSSKWARQSERRVTGGGITHVGCAQSRPRDDPGVPPPRAACGGAPDRTAHGGTALSRRG